MVTRKTASAALLRKLDAIQEYKKGAQNLTCSRDAYTVLVCNDSYEVFRDEIVAMEEFLYRPTVLEIGNLCDWIHYDLIEFLKPKKPEPRILPYPPLKVARVTPALKILERKRRIVIYEFDYKKFLISYFQRLPRFIGWTDAEITLRRDLLLDTIKTVVASPHPFFLNTRTRTRHAFHKVRLVDYVASEVDIYMIDSVMRQIKNGASSTEFAAFSNEDILYEMAKNDHSLNYLEVERKIAIAITAFSAAAQLPNQKVEEGIDFEILVERDRLASFKWKAKLAPLLPIERQQELRETIKRLEYFVRILKKNRSWLIEFLSR